MSRDGGRPSRRARLVAIVLGAGRAAIGTAFWVAPNAAATGLGFERIDAATKAVARIAGTRDLVLAAWALGALDDRERLRRASIAAATADGGDAVAFAALLRSGEFPAAAARGLAGAVPATAVGLWLIRDLGRSKSKGLRSMPDFR